MDYTNSELLDCRNKQGHGWIFYNCDGVLRHLDTGLTQEDDRAVIHKVKNLDLWDDDVMIVSYPKSGTHWLWEAVTMIKNHSSQYTKNKMDSYMLGLKVADNIHTLQAPRILASHLYCRHLPSELIQKKIKTICIMRNPKDICVSYYHYVKGFKDYFGFGGSLEEFVDLFLEGKVPYGSLFAYVQEWMRVKKEHPDFPLLHIYYEDVKKEPVKTVQAIARFLEEPISDELCHDIAEACGFSKLKTADQNIKEDEIWENYLFNYNKSTFRKGEIGDWKNFLDNAQSKAFDDVIEKELGGTGVSYTYE